jgi:transposase
MARPRSYPDEFRERAVRLVREWRAERGLSDGGLTVVAGQLGLHRETLRRWVLEQEADGVARPGPSRVERSRIAELVPRQATFARFTSSHSAWSRALRLRQAM